MFLAAVAAEPRDREHVASPAHSGMDAGAVHFMDGQLDKRRENGVGGEGDFAGGTAGQDPRGRVALVARECSRRLRANSWHQAFATWGAWWSTPAQQMNYPVGILVGGGPRGRGDAFVPGVDLETSWSGVDPETIWFWADLGAFMFAADPKVFMLGSDLTASWLWEDLEALMLGLPDWGRTQRGGVHFRGGPGGLRIGGRPGGRRHPGLV